MSSPIPPSARKRIRPVTERTMQTRTGTAPAARMISRRLKPKFSGDRAMLELQRELSLDPDLIPEPSSEGGAVIRPLLIRLCSVSALAAFVAWGLVSYSAVKKTAQINPVDTPVATIASGPAKSAEARPFGLRPSLSQTAEALAPIAKSQPVRVATASAAIASTPIVKEAAPAASPTIAPAPAPRSNERRVLRLEDEEIAILLKRGQDFLANGDLAAARLLLRRAAEAGSAEAALALGTTFDPVMLQRLGAIGAAADPAQARQWYQRAAELGSSAASRQLAGLGDVR
jgi:hypothetical protein